MSVLASPSRLFRLCGSALFTLLPFLTSPQQAADSPALAPPAAITLTSPLDYQVIQRHSRHHGIIPVRGLLPAPPPADAVWQIRLSSDDAGSTWLPFNPALEGASFSGTLQAPSGGWRRFELRVLSRDQTFASASVPHLGIGEVFLVAGQSNSANHGEQKQQTLTSRVASFDGARWLLANDPQRGASGRMGSFMPPLGDALVSQFDVPVGFIACGIGATSVREWLPRGARFPNPPTLETRVEKHPLGGWISKGAAYDTLIARLKPFAPNGLRAVLWHQGESDANQKDPSRTLPSPLYREYLTQIIVGARRDSGCRAPWFVAQASYHIPGDEGSPDIRAAQASLWADRTALEGPDSDSLKGPLRERDGQGVHFSGPGLRAHAEAWAAKLLPWLRQQP